MCDRPVPCACTIEQRAKIRAEHIERSDTLRDLAFRLHEGGHASEAEVELLYRQSMEEWDDAIHIASPDDPLRSLCGKEGRNLADLPDRPGGGSGCWTCLLKADELAPQSKELVTA
jgi:hypothetical protein